ncbi:MAG: rhodanese-like domain-containing protein [Thiobacillaceae bacterium]|jgi:rhodanese-related sulfurtransferase|nr:rhodanese-like domain-containing protein [Thiobacillaceae bacterium]
MATITHSDLFRSLRPVLAALVLAIAPPASAAQGGPDLAAPEAHALARAGQLTLIDIRTPREWRQTGVAEGVTRIDMLHPGGPRGFVDGVLARVEGDRDAPIGLICRTGNRTTHVQKLLQEHGFTRVYNIKEGMIGSAAGPGWIRRGLPVEPCAC